jgi:hypothetical protein
LGPALEKAMKSRGYFHKTGTGSVDSANPCIPQIWHTAGNDAWSPHDTGLRLYMSGQSYVFNRRVWVGAEQFHVDKFFLISDIFLLLP